MGKPLIVAPAMNTHMWDHPLTEKHISALEDLGCGIIMPMTKVLACGDKGVGALAPVPDIVDRVNEALGIKDTGSKDLAPAPTCWVAEEMQEGHPHYAQAQKSLEISTSEKVGCFAIIDPATQVVHAYVCIDPDSRKIKRVDNRFSRNLEAVLPSLFLL